MYRINRIIYCVLIFFNVMNFMKCFQCAASECVRDKTALIKREVSCLSNDQAMNDTSHCESLGTIPPTEMECSNKDCKAVWIASKWTRVLNRVFMIKFKMLYNLIICTWTHFVQIVAVHICSMRYMYVYVKAGKTI